MAHSLPDSERMEFDYINLPILAKLYLFNGFSIDLGPQFGYMVSAKRDGSDYSDGIDNKLDVSVALGLSYKIPFGLDVFTRYNFGVTYIQNNTEMNRVFQIGLGYRF